MIDMKPFLVVLDPGHGGEIDGVPVTAGKCSPDSEGPLRFIEGVFNRQMVTRLSDRLSAAHINYFCVAPNSGDTSLGARVRVANNLNLHNTAFYFSVHANAAPTWYLYLNDIWVQYNSRTPGHKDFFYANLNNSSLVRDIGGWNSVRGIEIYTSIGETRSDLCATIIMEEVSAAGIPDLMPVRADYLSDGDVDKEANYYVLKNTVMPAVLIECGFMTNKEDVKLMSDPTFQELLALSWLNAIQRIQTEIFYK